VAQCDVLMQRNEQRRGITAMVRSKLFRESGRFPALPELAAELDVHPSTLRRRLAEEHTSFRALLNEARSTLAVDLLRNVGLTVEEASKRLGATPTLRPSATRSNGGTVCRRASTYEEPRACVLGTQSSNVGASWTEAAKEPAICRRPLRHRSRAALPLAFDRRR